MRFKEAKSQQDFYELKVLFREYFEELKNELGTQDFKTELNLLEETYTKANNFFILVKDVDGNLAGCGGIKKFDEGRCELKRVYIRPKYRGQGIAAILMKKIIEKAKMLNSKIMLLDTAGNLTPAIRLYKNLGFKEIPPYCDGPCKDPVYMSLELL